jgi:hypothetical protein
VRKSGEHIKDLGAGRMSDAAGGEFKEITVKLVERDEYGARTERSAVTRRIDRQHTIQEAVTDVYQEFPAACRWVVLKRAGTLAGVYAETDMDMWDSTRRGARLWALSWYDTINAGDTVEIHVIIAKPTGPRRGAPAFEGGVVLEDGDEGRDIEHPPGGPHEARASLARAERTRGLLAELQALHVEVCESEGKRMEGLEHLGTMVQKFRETVCGKQYGHIKLTILPAYEKVDLMWPQGDINGLQDALEHQRHRHLWDYVKDDKERYYFSTRKGLEPFKALTNWSILQNEVETKRDSRELTLRLL